MPTGYYQHIKQPRLCPHTTMPKCYQWCSACHLAYWCCATCMHLHRCDTCTQQAAAAGSEGDRGEGGQ